jgi:phosphoenolpyruvate carboxykinase (ATP)
MAGTCGLALAGSQETPIFRTDGWIMKPGKFPLTAPRKIHHNLLEAELYERVLSRGEGRVAASGALSFETGVHTGRSPNDKFTVRDANTDKAVWWDNNRAITPAQFETLLTDFLAHAKDREMFVQDLYAGADPAHRISTRVFTELAWHSLFIRHMLRRPPAADLASFAPEFTVVNCPSFKADPARHGVRTETVIACDLTNRLVLIGGSSYAGETKKSVFTFLNYFYPGKGIMPMHASANVGLNGDTAIFFGLSGTGKTTLSADARRTLLGDDEHGWSGNGVFNFEGGCYAKTIRLSAEAEPEIYAASNRFGAVLENVVLDPRTREPDFDNGSLTENTRSCYPLEFIPNASKTGHAGHPKNIVMLCADAFGVLPPIAKLSPSQAMYHFLSGYTAKVAGTEKGLGADPSATFSTCFGAPFLPRHPSDYGNMLRELIAKHNVDCWLVNTGWTGGKHGVGHRMPIKATRALLNAALSGELRGKPMRKDAFFGFEVPTELAGVDPKILNPRETWADKMAYDATALALVDMFNTNFSKYESHVDADVKAAAPAFRAAAE